jgi:hypothetical protein
MVKNSTQRKTAWVVFLAFLFLATTGLVATVNMSHDMQHSCPFYGVTMEDCSIVTSGNTANVLHHIEGFKSVVQNTFAISITLLVVLMIIAFMVMLVGVWLYQKQVRGDRAVLLLLFRTYSRPPSFYKFQRWLVLHSKSCIPDMHRVVGCIA